MNDELSATEIEMDRLEKHTGKLIKALGPLFQRAHNDINIGDDRYAVNSLRIVPFEDYYLIDVSFKVSRNGL